MNVAQEIYRLAQFLYEGEKSHICFIIQAALFQQFPERVALSHRIPYRRIIGNGIAPHFQRIFSGGRTFKFVLRLSKFDVHFV